MNTFKATAGVAAFAAAIALVATPAFAASNDPSAPAPKAERAAPKMSTRYCIRETRVGSLIPSQTCKTRGEWIEQDGIDPATLR